MRARFERNWLARQNSVPPLTNGKRAASFGGDQLVCLQKEIASIFGPAGCVRSADADWIRVNGANRHENQNR